MPAYSATVFKTCVCCCLFVCLPKLAHAQHYQHTTFWARLVVTKPLSKKWDFQFEYLHRSQNNFLQSMWNPFAHEALEEPRIWFNFNEKHYTVLLNPITYFYSEPNLGKEADFNVKPNHIWQAVVALEMKQNIKKWTIKERIMYEYRWIESLNYVPVGRIRLRGLLQYQVNEKIKLQAYNDIFFNAPPHKLEGLFDQNWFSFGISRQLNRKLTLDMAYMRNHRERSNHTEFDEENALSFALNIKL